MIVSESLLDVREDIWGAQTNYPFVRELAAGTLNEAAFEHGVNQNHRYLINYTQGDGERLFRQTVEHKATFCETAYNSANEIYDVEDCEGNT